VLWLNDNFLLQEEIVVDENDNLDVCFLSLRVGHPLVIQMTTDGKVCVSCARFHGSGVPSLR
jgi:hypothetical protein